MADLYRTMAKYGWRDIHYGNPFLPTDTPKSDLPGHWRIGLYTGPNSDLCVKYCATEEEVERYRSPRANSITEAIAKSRLLLEGRSGGCRAKSQSLYRGCQVCEGT